MNPNREYVLTQEAQDELARRYNATKQLKQEQGIMKYKENDILVDEDGNTRKVLGVCGQVYFMSYAGEYESHSDGYTKEELEKDGYRLKTTESTIEIDGKKYNREAVAERLSELEEVE